MSREKDESSARETGYRQDESIFHGFRLIMRHGNEAQRRQAWHARERQIEHARENGRERPAPLGRLAPRRLEHSFPPPFNLDGDTDPAAQRIVPDSVPDNDDDTNHGGTRVVPEVLR